MAFPSKRNNFIEPQALVRLGPLELHARFPMQGNVSGRHRSPHRGSSLEFAEYRKYVPGDDTRRLDWRAFGRSDRFYIKEFEADTNLRCYVVIDASGSMNYGSGEKKKIDYARNLAATLGYLIVRQGDALGLVSVNPDQTVSVPPKRNPAHLSAVFDTLADAKPSGEIRLAEALHELAGRTRQRALVVILSDLFMDPDLLVDCFQHLRFRKHDVAVFHLLDPQEIDFPFNRPTRFVDLEGGAPLITETAVIAEQYRNAVTRYLDRVKSASDDAAIDYHRVMIDEDYSEVLARFLINRMPKRRKR